MHMTAGYILISNWTPLIKLTDASLINGQSGLNEQQHIAKDTNRTVRAYSVMTYAIMLNDQRK